MRITNIRESGTSSTLRWAISNGADIKNDLALQSIINDELFYLVTISDVTFFERFRLIQKYRNTLRTCSSSVSYPSDAELNTWFHAEAPVSGQTAFPADQLGDSPVDNAKAAIDAFNNLTLQMKADEDIIDGTSRYMFTPMINMRYTIQIPVSFITVVEALSVDDAHKIFNADYPNGLDLISDDQISSVAHAIEIGYLRDTSPVKYDANYEKYIAAMKYLPVSKPMTEGGADTYRVGLLSFYKYDPVLRGETRCNLIPMPKPEEIQASMKILQRLKTPLKAEIVIHAPIYVISDILNAFSHTDLPTKYESSITNIIGNAIEFNNFIEPSLDTSIENDPAEIDRHRQHTDAIDNYRIRIAEATETSLKSLTKLMEKAQNWEQYVIDQAMAYSVLPAAFNARMVITLDSSQRSNFIMSEISTDQGRQILTDAWQMLDNLSTDITNVT